MRASNRPMPEPPREGAAHESPRKPKATAGDKVLVAASGFTSLWALTWLGAEALAVNAAMQGGFAVGGVVASGGLAALWWKTRTMKQLHSDDEDDEDAPQEM
jgi:hypothetical protein